MWFFIVQYKKLLVLCAIPVIAAAAFFSFRYVHVHSDGSDALAVNEEMRQLLDAAKEPKESPAPSAVEETNSTLPSELADQESAQPNDPNSTVKKSLKKEKTSSKSKIAKATAKPAKTPKPMPASKPSPSPSSKPTLLNKVNINMASIEELMVLPDIGDSKAKLIIAYREQVKGFKTIEELMDVKGIGPKIFAKLKEHIEL
jgi:competence protein ComEA